MLFFMLLLLLVVNVCPVKTCTYTIRPLPSSSDSPLLALKRSELLEQIRSAVSAWKLPESLYDVGGERHFSERTPTSSSFHGSKPLGRLIKDSRSVPGSGAKFNTTSAPLGKSWNGKKSMDVEFMLKVIQIASATIGIVGVLVIGIILYFRARSVLRNLSTIADENTGLLSRIDMHVGRSRSNPALRSANKHWKSSVLHLPYYSSLSVILT